MEPLPAAQGLAFFLPEILESILFFCPRSVLLNSARFVNKKWYRASLAILQQHHNLVWNHSLVEPLPIQSVRYESSVNGEGSNRVMNAQDITEANLGMYPSRDPVASHDLTALNKVNDSLQAQTSSSRRQQLQPLTMTMDSYTMTRQERFSAQLATGRVTGVTIDKKDENQCCNWLTPTAPQRLTNHPKWAFALAGFCEIDGSLTWCGKDDIRSPPEELLPEDGPQWDRLVIHSIQFWPRYSHHEILFDAIGQCLRYLEMNTSKFPIAFDLVLALEHLPCLEHIRLGATDARKDWINSPSFMLLNAKEQRVWYDSGYRGLYSFSDAAAAAASKRAPSPKPAPFLRLQKMDLISANMPFMPFCRLVARLPNLIHLSLITCQFKLDNKLGWKEVFPDEHQRQRFRHFGYSCGEYWCEEQVKNIVESFPNLVSLHLPDTTMKRPIFQTIQQHYATNLRSLDLRLCRFHEDVTYQFHNLLCAGKFKNLVHLIAPYAYFLISDLEGDGNLWQTPQLRVLITSFNALAQRLSNGRSVYSFRNPGYSSSARDVRCSCLGPWEQDSYRRVNRSKGPVPQHACCEASSVLAEFLSTQCPLLEDLQIKIKPQACLGYPGLSALGRLKQLRSLRIWLEYLDRTQRQDLEWIQDMTGSTLFSQQAAKCHPSSAKHSFDSLQVLDIFVMNSIYDRPHDVLQWLCELAQSRFDCHLVLEHRHCLFDGFQNPPYFFLQSPCI
ncbi:hypothetical protein BGZ94_009577 [Podila epigama]|nr:hypothetical protein BGZ94_009577 [Podila epigama]